MSQHDPSFEVNLHAYALMYHNGNNNNISIPNNIYMRKISVVVKVFMDLRICVITCCVFDNVHIILKRFYEDLPRFLPQINARGHFFTNCCKKKELQKILIFHALYTRLRYDNTI